MAKEKIKVHIVNVGGDFGAKASLIDVPIAYYLSKATGRPVKLVFDYTEDILAGGHRHPAVITLRTGVAAERNLYGVKATIYFSGGAYGSQKANPQVTVLGGRRLASMYRCPAIEVRDLLRVHQSGALHADAHAGQPADRVCLRFASRYHRRRDGHRCARVAPEKYSARRRCQSPMGEKWNHILMGEVLERVVKASGWKKGGEKKNRGWGMALYDRGTPEGKGQLGDHARKATAR